MVFHLSCEAEDDAVKLEEAARDGDTRKVKAGSGFRSQDLQWDPPLRSLHLY